MNIKMRTLFASTQLSTMPKTFENKNGWKVDADGKLVVDSNGNPIYTKEDGSEQAVEGGTISRLNGEAKTNRERAEAAEGKVKLFGDIDPGKAKEAIEKLKMVDQKKLVDSGEIETLKRELGAQYQTQIDQHKSENEGLQGKLNNMTLAVAFKGSDFIKEKIAVPPEMFEAQFGKNFKVEEGKVVPYYADGNKVFSKKRMGEVADVDEAFELLVDQYAHKDAILKAPSGGGSGNNGNGGNRGGGRTIRRSDFETMNASDQAATAAAVGKGEAQIID